MVVSSGDMCECAFTDYCVLQTTSERSVRAAGARKTQQQVLKQPFLGSKRCKKHLRVPKIRAEGAENFGDFIDF